MKTSLPFYHIKNIFIVVAVFASLGAVAQPGYSFIANSLVSGTDKHQGAVYRFTTVKPGVDALVTIDTLTGGLTLDSLDVATLGFNAAFQPQIHIAAHNSGYAQFNIQFVITGTSTPMIQLNMPVTSIDIDGHIAPGDTLAEYDQVDLGLTGTIYDDPSTTQISVTTSGSWITGKNIGGVEYTGVDTLGKDAMFTVVNPSTTSFKVRTGVDNRTNGAVSRNSSVFFQKFNYLYTLLPVSPITNFTGNDKDNTVKLQWTLASLNTLQSVILQKSYNGIDFTALNEYWINVDNHSSDNEDFHYTDNDAQSIIYYRLKMVSDNGNTGYSNLLNFETAFAANNKLRVYPTVISGTATINFLSEKSSAASFQLVDYSGRIVYQRKLQVADGNNDISINNFGNLITGNYIAVLRTPDKVYNQKVMMK
jgi:hypothetical protein